LSINIYVISLVISRICAYLWPSALEQQLR